MWYVWWVAVLISAIELLTVVYNYQGEKNYAS